MVESNPLTRLWKGKATVYEYEQKLNPDTGQMVQKKVIAFTDEPCHLSFNREQATDVQSGAAVVSQSTTLFIRPDILIKPGSVISVTQNGRTDEYEGSSKPAVYSKHQEITLKLKEKNA